MNALELLLSSTFAALLLLGTIESMTQFVRIASSAQTTFDARIARQLQPPVCGHYGTAISSTCSAGERQIIQFHTRYKKFND